MNIKEDDNYMSDNKIWYYKMKRGFWQDDKIVNMENLPMYGDKFIVTLLKLYDYSIQNGGVIKVTNYASEANYATQLAKICRVDTEIMELALSYFLKHGLMEIENNNESPSVVCQLPYVQNNTGSISEDAIRKREYRARLKNNDKPLLEATEIENQKNVYGAFNNIHIEENEYYKLKGIYENIDHVINRASIAKDANLHKGKADEELINEFIKEFGKLREN